MKMLRKKITNLVTTIGVVVFVIIAMSLLGFNFNKELENL